MALAEAPFDREDPTLNPAAGACSTCPRRSAYNTSLFSDVTDGDQCLDGACYQTKLSNHIDREVAARPELIQIENGWRHHRGQRPRAVQRGVFREIDIQVENPDAEPAPPCAAAKPALIVYGKRIGTTITVCTDNHCPVHDPRAAAALAANPAPQLAPAIDTETEGVYRDDPTSWQQVKSKFYIDESYARECEGYFASGEAALITQPRIVEGRWYEACEEMPDGTATDLMNRA